MPYIVKQFSWHLRRAAELGGRVGGFLTRGIWYERDLLHHIRTQAISGVYVDVGANIGNHTIYFALNTKATHVFAIEPTHTAARQCAEIARLNGMADRVTVLNVAATDQRGFMEFTGGTAHRPLKHRAPGIRLDDVIPDGVGLIKIDVDLAGAKRGYFAGQSAFSPKTSQSSMSKHWTTMSM